MSGRPGARASSSSPGRYALEVSRADCPDPWTRSVFLEPDGVHRYEALICAGHGHLVIRANTEGDRVRIDDLDVGHTGNRAHRLTVGEHTIRVDKSGYRPFEARVRIGPDESVELRADLLRMGEAEGKAGRPMPVTRVAPSLPPIDAKSIQGFTKEELHAGIEPPKLDPPNLGLPKRGEFLAREGLPAMPDGGSTAWHDRVSKELRERFDQDRSGEIDSLAESEAISCSVWREIERDFDRGGLGLSLAHYYGFDGSEWHPGALAVARPHRSAVYAKMGECGLAPESRPMALCVARPQAFGQENWGFDRIRPESGVRTLPVSIRRIDWSRLGRSSERFREGKQGRIHGQYRGG
ncbi:MAG: PEGA domain-containing protein [Deltaproteobacteria bacterium]|nr:PEGA domain-containing protein [Deltaproteobacteria bacterium]